VAIVPVLLFHAGLGGLRGGFLGVDVFFVISGYLITRILVRELNDGTYSLARFYQRRILRIFPALAAVLAVTSVVACVMLLPVELRMFGSSLFATSLFGSNVWFWRTSDYFTAVSTSVPLLHTWSLAIEEQFYLLFPILLAVTFTRFRRWLLPAIATVAGGSLLLNVLMAGARPSATFYLLPTRAWELACGALVAVAALPALGSRTRNGLACAAAVMLASAYILTPSSAYAAGWWSAAPCFGAAVLIAYGDRTIVGRLLESAPLVWIGLISYSLYLWHWPALVFARVRFGDQLDPRMAWSVLAATVVAAIGSYVLVERPFRSRRFRQRSARPILAWGALVVVVFAAMGLVARRFSDRLTSLPDDIRRIASFADYRAFPESTYQFRQSECLVWSADPKGFAQFNKETCLRSTPTGRNFLVLGDSHAAQMYRAIAAQFPDAAVSQATASGCVPVLPIAGEQRCTDLISFVFNEYLPSHKVDAIFIAGRWMSADVQSVVPTIEYVRKYVPHVVILGPIVEYAGTFPSLLARDRMRATSTLSRFIVPSRKQVDRELAAVVARAGVPYVSMYDLQCPAALGGGCIEQVDDGTPLQFDYGHMTLAGSMVIGAKLKQVLLAMPGGPAWAY